MTEPRPYRAVALVFAAGLVACNAAAPSATPPRASGDVRTVSPATAATGPPAPSATGPRLGSLEYVAGTLEPAWTDPLRELASDGESVIFSSGAAEGPGGDAAPDLWRYAPGAVAPEMLWRNPRRDHSLVRIGGDGKTWAMAEVPTDGSRAWNLWLLTEPGGEPRRLDSYVGDDTVPSLVPSFDIDEGRIAWTAFDRSLAGPVSQLFVAEGPDWAPRLIAERLVAESELWLPSLRGTRLAYAELTHTGPNDEHRVYVIDLDAPAAEPQRLDESGLATMPLLVEGGVVWKEIDPGFSMFNWGTLRVRDDGSGATTALRMNPQKHVNYPSAGARFVAAWGADASRFTIHDLATGSSRYLERHSAASHASVLRPHVRGDLLVWIHTTEDDAATTASTEVRYALLPDADAP